MTCPSFGINASAAAIAHCRRHLDAIGLGCSRRWARECDNPQLPLQNARFDDPHHHVSRAETATISCSRKPYAVAPLGTIPQLAAIIPPARTDFVDVANHNHVTNLGTLLDVLA